MVVIGVDPGLSVTGYAAIRKREGSQPYELVEAGFIKTDSKRLLPVRLKEIYDDMLRVIQSTGAKVLAVEDPFSMATKAGTAMLMAHARAVILLAAQQSGIEVAGFSPARVKKYITGVGSASKLQVQQMVRERLSLTELPEPSHVADALAVAMCYVDSMQFGEKSSHDQQINRIARKSK